MSLSKRLPHAEQLALVLRAQQGDQRARETLIRTNERLVLTYAYRVNSWGYAEMEDVIQAGRIWLNRAIDKFKADAGTVFATYAGWWIKAEMQGAVGEASMMGGLSARNILFGGKGNYTDEHRALALHSLRGMSRLDAPLGEDETTAGDLLAGDEPSPAEQVEDADTAAHLKSTVGEILSMLTPKQQEVARRRFMLDEPDTLEAIGNDQGVCRERIRQVEALVRARLQRIATTHPAIIAALEAA